jgi:hypothetical protein
MHQTFISFFFKQPKRKKVVKVSAGSRRQAGHPRFVPTGTTHTEEVIVVDNGDSEVDSDEDEAVEEEAAVFADATEGNNGQSVHDNSVVKTLRDRAIQIMKDRGVVIEMEDQRMALQLFPRVRHYPICCLSLICFFLLRLQVLLAVFITVLL